VKLQGRFGKLIVLGALIGGVTVVLLSLAIFNFSPHFEAVPTANTKLSTEPKETVAVKSQPQQTTLELRPSLAPSIESPPSLHGLDQIPLSLAPLPPVAPKDPSIKAFDPNAKGKETLPWDLVEPVPVSPPRPVSSPRSSTPAFTTQSTTPALASIEKLTAEKVSTWLRSTVKEVKGEDQERPLAHFELWLEPTGSFKDHILSVTYAFSSPAIVPQSQTSRDAKSGFRIAFGGLACVDTITLTFGFDVGGTQTVDVDGCRTLQQSSSQE
jgi:hypothetical protein